LNSRHLLNSTQAGGPMFFLQPFEKQTVSTNSTRFFRGHMPFLWRNQTFQMWTQSTNAYWKNGLIIP